MAGPLVSVIIPCFRQAHFLPATLDSVLAQTYPDVEIVLVNDGSDDDTAAVADRYRNRIRYVWQPNAGLPAARNTGIAHSRGKYLYFLDSDDRTHPDSIRWLVEAAGGREDALCVMGWRFFEQDNALDVDVERLPIRPLPLGLALLAGNLGPPHAYLSPRSMVERTGGFDRTLRSCEDWDMWRRLLFAGAEVVPVLRAGALYRQHAQAMTRNLVRMADTAAEVLRRNLRGIKADPDLVTRLGGSPRAMRRLVRRRIAEELLGGAYHLRQQGSYWGACKMYLRGAVQGAAPLEAGLGLAKLPPHRLLRGHLDVRSVSRFHLSLDARRDLAAMPAAAAR